MTPKLPAQLALNGLVVECPNFQPVEGGPPQRTLALIVPTLLYTEEDGAVRIRWSCSRGRVCFYRPCFYAHGWEATRKQEE